MNSSIWIISTAGLTATVPMILFMHFAAIITNQQLRVINILGTMLTAETSITKKVSASRRSILTGTIAIFATGILFSYVFYRLVVNSESFSLRSFFIFLMLFSIAGVGGWKILFYLHSNPPSVPLSGFLRYMFAGNLLFVTGLFIMYKILFH